MQIKSLNSPAFLGVASGIHIICVFFLGPFYYTFLKVQITPTSEESSQHRGPRTNWCFLCRRHALIRKLSQLRDSEPELAQLLVDQIYENAMIAAGLVDDLRPMVGRLNHLLVKALERH